ncbi:UNKNOWN [Stylonychia lemnae]|uniref:Origin recognition complex subunit 4 C-terminal domain-containing protein n=1 Tax=Stylonychia lemnae TaxID=5949 RepID=A0A078B5Z9_STYLE|nr:UNKNOWN [Stylonychia lemnae]|eukprot:CDW89844.1 UNKNOWN [Stylonychia lemnae]
MRDSRFNEDDFDDDDNAMEIDVPQSKINKLKTQNQLEKLLGDRQAFRSKGNTNKIADLSPYSAIIQQIIIRLTNLTKQKIESFYKNQYDQVMDILYRSYSQGDNNSFLLLSRTKQTLHSFISQISSDITIKLKSNNQENNLKIIRVNSILSNTEAKILMKLSESLNLKHASQAFHSFEMMEHIKQYFDENQNISVCFILEDIDYYVENTKQVLLYKILDMFGYLKIKFVFIATSVKLDIADSFEKRIKSRFSHRMILFYEQTIEKFINCLSESISELIWECDDIKYRKQVLLIQNAICAVEVRQVLNEEFEMGKNYEYLAQMLRISLSSLDQIISQKMIAPEYDQILQSELTDFFNDQLLVQLKQFEQLKQNSEPIKILEKMTKAQLIVLIAAKKVAQQASIFNFEAVFKKFRDFMKSHSQFGLNLSKQVFLKTFLDLIHNGFLKSDSETDLLNVNNKIALGFQQKDLNKMIYETKGKLHLPQILEAWALKD